MTDIEKAKQLFRSAGLAFPTIPQELAVQLRELKPWLFSTRTVEIEISPYNLHDHVREVKVSQVKDYAVLSHSGHGINSYAIHHYIVQGSLCLFLQLGWGGVYMDEKETTTQIRECFSMADQIVQASQIARFEPGQRMIIVGSDFSGSCFWLPPRKRRSRVYEDRKGPLKTLTRALAWLTSRR